MGQYGLYKKINVRFSVTENVDMISMLGQPALKYSSSYVEDGFIKYYKNGFTLMKTSEFSNKLGRTCSIRPSTDYVLLASMSSDVVPNGKAIIKTRNRVAMVLPVDVRMVQDGDKTYTNIGLSLDINRIDVNQLVINLYNGQGELTGRTVEVREYVEDPDDIVSDLNRQLDPIFDVIGSVVRSSSVKIWEDERGAQAMITFIEKALIKAGLYTVGADQFRKALGEALISGATVRKCNIDDVIWDSKEDMDYMINECSGDIDMAKELRKGELRLKQMLDNMDLKARLQELTRDEVNNKDNLRRPNITLAMTDDEIDRYYKSDDKEELATLELTVLERWMEAQNG